MSRSPCRRVRGGPRAPRNVGSSTPAPESPASCLTRSGRPRQSPRQLRALQTPSSSTSRLRRCGGRGAAKGGRSTGRSAPAGRRPSGLHADVELSKPSAVALLDAAIHVARLLDSSNPRLMIPAAVASVRFEAELADQRGRIEVHRRGGNDEELIVDIAVKAPDGSTCIDVRGLRYAAVDSTSAASRNDDPSTMVHTIDWQPFQPVEGDADSHQTARWPSTIAVLGEDSIVRTLRDRLGRRRLPAGRRRRGAICRSM